MPAGVEVGVVVATLILEVFAAEVVALGANATIAGAVKEWDAVLAAHVAHGVNHLLAVRALEVVGCPRAEEHYLRRWIAADEPLAKRVEVLSEPLDGDERVSALTKPLSVVVTANNDYVVEVGAHVTVAVIDARAPSLEVDGQAVAVAPVVIVVHVVLAGELVVPRQANGLSVVFNVAVAYHAYVFAPERVFAPCHQVGGERHWQQHYD